MAVACNRPLHTEGTRSINLGKVSTLHKESELKAVVYDGSDSSDEETTTMEAKIVSSLKQEALPFEVCRRPASAEVSHTYLSSHRT